jgi:hypothetical protein
MAKRSGRIYLSVAGILLSALAIIPSVVSQGVSVTCSPWTIKGTTVNFENCLLFGQYTLNWKLNGQSATIGFGYPTTTEWVGIAFTKDKDLMIGSNSVIGRPSSDGVVVQEYFLGGKSSRQVVPANNLNPTGMAGEIVGGELRFIFTVTLTPAQLSTSNIIWARGGLDPSGGLRFHNAGQSAGNVGFATGVTSAGGGNTMELRNAHGFMNALAWGLLIPLGIIVARHGKRHEPAWYYFHLVCQTLGMTLGLIGFITGLIAVRRSRGSRPTHRTLGILILILGVFQALAICLRPHKGAKLRGLWEIQHHWSGRSALILAVANVYIGFNILQPPTGWKVAFSIAIAVYGVTAIGLEVWRQFFEGGVPDSKRKGAALGEKVDRRGSDNDIEIQPR